MPQFMFDAELTVTFRFEAESEEAARAHLRKELDCTDITFCSAPDGSPITSEVTLNNEPVLVEIDEEAVGDPTSEQLAPMAGETVIGRSAHYVIYESSRGYRLVRLSDAMQVIWHGDDACEDFHRWFEGDEMAAGDEDAIAENTEATEKLGQLCEWKALMVPPVRKPLPEAA
jgi:hypothetical protein